MTEQEIWVSCLDWPEYHVSSEGRVRRAVGGRGARSGHIMAQRKNRDGYACVTLSHNDQRKGFLVSRLVCAAFHGPPHLGDEAAHADGDRGNNRLSNLRWATPAENAADREIHGTQHRGEHHVRSKLTEQAVLAIRSDDRPQSKIAKQYGIAQSLVSMVKHRRVWAHV